MGNSCKFEMPATCHCFDVDALVTWLRQHVFSTFDFRTHVFRGWRALLSLSLYQCGGMHLYANSLKPMSAILVSATLRQTSYILQVKTKLREKKKYILQFRVEICREIEIEIEYASTQYICVRLIHWFLLHLRHVLDFRWQLKVEFCVFWFYWLKRCERRKAKPDGATIRAEYVPDKEGLRQACALVAVEITRQWSESIIYLFAIYPKSLIFFSVERTECEGEESKKKVKDAKGIDFGWVRTARHTHIRKPMWMKIACLETFRKLVKCVVAVAPYDVIRSKSNRSHRIRCQNYKIVIANQKALNRRKLTLLFLIALFFVFCCERIAVAILAFFEFR